MMGIKAAKLMLGGFARLARLSNGAGFFVCFFLFRNETLGQKSEGAKELPNWQSYQMIFVAT